MNIIERCQREAAEIWLRFFQPLCFSYYSGDLTFALFCSFQNICQDDLRMARQMLIDVLEVTKNHHIIPVMKEWMDSEEFYKMSSIMSTFPVGEGKMAKNYPEITLYYGKGLVDKIESLDGVVNFFRFMERRKFETSRGTQYRYELNEEEFTQAVKSGKTIFMDLDRVHEENVHVVDKNLASKIFHENLDAKIIMLVRESKDNYELPLYSNKYELPYLNKVEVRAITKVFHYL